jgi:hypothetical protein
MMMFYFRQHATSQKNGLVVGRAKKKKKKNGRKKKKKKKKKHTKSRGSGGGIVVVVVVVAVDISARGSRIRVPAGRLHGVVGAAGLVPVRSGGRMRHFVQGFKDSQIFFVKNEGFLETLDRSL